MVEKKEENVSEQSGKSYKEEIESFRWLAGDVDADRLKDFVQKITSGAGHDISPLVLSPSSDKGHRTVLFRGGHFQL